MSNSILESQYSEKMICPGSKIKELYEKIIEHGSWEKKDGEYGTYSIKIQPNYVKVFRSIPVSDNGNFELSASGEKVYKEESVTIHTPNQENGKTCLFRQTKIHADVRDTVPSDGEILASEFSRIIGGAEKIIENVIFHVPMDAWKKIAQLAFNAAQQALEK